MHDFDPEKDLQIERLMNGNPQAIWRCWEEPDLFKRWFTPPPVEVAEVDYDLRPGGRSYVVMKMPDGSLMPSEGCFLVADRYKRLIFTDAVMKGFRPAETTFMTADIELTPKDGGTLYRVHVMHASAAQKDEHEKMGFHDGWGTTLRQLDELVATVDA